MTTAPAVSLPVSRLDDPDHELYIYQSGNWRGWRAKATKKEPWTFDWLKEIGKGTLYDVGACVGSYSLMAAARGATVVAIEPVPWNYAECYANVYLNEMESHITVLPVAAGPEDGTAILRHPMAPSPGYGEGGTDRNFSREPWHLRIPQIALANLEPFPPPTHVKIDVEGREVGVLTGMAFDSVESLIVEIRDDNTEMDAIMVMRSHGFESAWKGGYRTEQQRTHIFRRAT